MVCNSSLLHSAGRFEDTCILDRVELLVGNWYCCRMHHFEEVVTTNLQLVLTSRCITTSYLKKMLQDVTSLHDAIILMPQSSRSRHQRTRFPRPHWVATAATAWQTAAVWYLVKHQTVRGFEQEEWISLKPGQIKTNQTASRSASWMFHDLTTSLTCFRTGWQSGFGWYGIF